jgi:predicted RNase H-like nuclease (RuvC/YqgF family)
MKMLIILSILGVMSSCVSKSSYEELQNENYTLQNELRMVKMELSSLQREYEANVETIRELERKKREKKFFSEEQALSFLKDYYSFYNADFIYRNARMRRVDNNTFKISLEENFNKESFKNIESFWSSKVKTLVINNDGTYKIN